MAGARRTGASVFLAAALFLGAAMPSGASPEEPLVLGEQKFLIISAPRLQQVVYLKLTPKAKWAMPLVNRQLKAPYGVAVDSERMHLFVADSERKAIFWYGIAVTPTGSLALTTKQNIAVNNVQARWVVLDKAGNIFYSDEGNNLIGTVKIDRFLKKDPMPHTIYNGNEMTSLSSPGGIAVDNFHIFWTNKEAGTDVGSVVKALEVPPDYDLDASTSKVADNALKVYGICMELENIFYTENGHVYGVKKEGGAVSTISDKLVDPRGCVSDGEGTVYVADRGGNAIYTFPGNMERTEPEPLELVLKFEDSFGLALLNTPGSGSLRNAPRLLAMAVGLVLLLVLRPV